MDDVIGQLIWAFISSRDDLEPAAQAAQDGRISGVWLLPTEMRSAAETAMLVNWFQASSPTPLLIGVDAEAGLGLVMGAATETPTAMALGASGATSLTFDAARITAIEAAACGINAVAAPVLDVNINPANPIINTRAFAGDPATVGRHGRAWLDGAKAGAGTRVLPIGKHFPGHGDTARDSHLHLETVPQPRERLEDVELPPFKEAIAAGIPMLMTAHVGYPALDREAGIPATLSYPILTELLRNELGFEGVVVTDCMNMHAIASNFDGRDAAVRSIQAGCDLVLTDDWTGAFEALRRAQRTGKLSDERVSQAAERVHRLKATIFGENLAHPVPVSPEGAQVSVGTPQNAEVAKRIAAASITLVSGELSEPSDRPLILATRMARRFGPMVEVQLRAALSSIGWQNADVLMLDPSPDHAQIAAARERAEAAGWVALLHFNRVQSFDPDAVQTPDELVRLAALLAEAGVPPIVVSMGSPYALPLFTAARARVCAYSTCDASLRATLEVLMGTARATGVLPVELVSAQDLPVAI
jgi:beta-N-acetylhexosaminidase